MAFYLCLYESLSYFYYNYEVYVSIPLFMLILQYVFLCEACNSFVVKHFELEF